MPPQTPNLKPQTSNLAAQPPAPEPFTFNAGESAVGILLLHGWTGSPPEMQPLGAALAAQGWTVHGPLLPGHGTRPEDMLTVNERDWIAAAAAAYTALAAECETVFVGGLSMGGLLALDLGATLPRPPAGIIAMSAPIYITDWRRHLAPAAPLLTRFQPWSHKEAVRHDVDPTTASRLWDYRRYPTISGHHIVRLMNRVRARLPQVRAPLLVMQGRQDRTVVPASAQYIYDHVASPDKTLVWWERSAHCITVDAERAAVWSRTATWIAAHVPAAVVGG